MLLEQIQTVPKHMQIRVLDLNQRIVHNFLVSWPVFYQDPSGKVGLSFIKCHWTMSFSAICWCHEPKREIQLWICGRGMNCFQNKNKTKCVFFAALCQWAKMSTIATVIVSLECQAIYEEQITGEENEVYYCITKLIVSFVMCKTSNWQLSLWSMVFVREVWCL